MKRLFLIVVAVAAMGVGRGQEFSVNASEENRNLDLDMVLNGHYLGSLEGLDVWLTKSKEGVKEFANRRDWHVVKLSDGLLPMERLELPLSERCDVLCAVGGKQKGGDVHSASMLMVDSNVVNRIAILRARVSLDSMQLKGGHLDTVDYFTYGKKDIIASWGAVSPNGRYMGVLTIVQYVERQEYISVARVFDAEANQVWVTDYAMGATNAIYVDDSGTMYTLGAQRVRDGVHFTLNVVNSKRADTYSMTMQCDPVHDMGILNVLGPHVLCAGLFTAERARYEEEMSSGVVTMSFNIDSASLSGFSMRFFQNEDMNIMLNKNSKKTQRFRDMSRVMPMGSLRMPYGVVMAVGHHHVLHYTNVNGTVEDSWYAQGLHLLAFDIYGNIKWVRNIRRNDMTGVDDGMLYVSMFVDGDKACLVKNENRKEPENYNITKESREYEVGDKSNLVLYTISAEGDVRKAYLEKDTKHALVNMVRREDGTLLLLTMRGNKCRRVEVKK
jgi:hypothetical protein